MLRYRIQNFLSKNWNIEKNNYSFADLSNIKLSVQPIGLINEGDTVILFCQHTTSEPVTYRWFHNDQLLPGNLEYWILSNVKIVDGGIYVCTADHRIIGKKSSPPIAIDINCE